MTLVLISLHIAAAVIHLAVGQITDKMHLILKKININVVSLMPV